MMHWKRSAPKEAKFQLKLRTGWFPFSTSFDERSGWYLVFLLITPRIWDFTLYGNISSSFCSLERWWYWLQAWRRSFLYRSVVRHEQGHRLLRRLQSWFRLDVWSTLIFSNSFPRCVHFLSILSSHCWRIPETDTYFTLSKGLLLIVLFRMCSPYQLLHYLPEYLLFDHPPSSHWIITSKWWEI